MSSTSLDTVAVSTVLASGVSGATTSGPASAVVAVAFSGSSNCPVPSAIPVPVPVSACTSAVVTSLVGSDVTALVITFAGLSVSSF